MGQRQIARLILCILSISLALSVPVFSHPGRTDSSGGHSSGSGYHYHHGYPAHQHINGTCPYDFDDQTGKNSGSPTSKATGADTKSPSGQPQREETAPAEPSTPPNVWWIVGGVAVCAVAALIVRAVILARIRRKKEAAARKETIRRWYEEYDEKPFAEVFQVPEGFVLGDDDEPIKLSGSAEDLNVYMVRPGGAYHRRGCRYAWSSPCKMWEAQSMGCYPCWICFPPFYDFSWYFSYKNLKKTMANYGIQFRLDNGTILLEYDIEDASSTD